MAFESSTFEVTRSAISKSIIYRDLKYVFVGECLEAGPKTAQRTANAIFSTTLMLQTRELPTN
jgi:hypothetical protein